MLRLQPSDLSINEKCTSSVTDLNLINFESNQCQIDLKLI